MSDDGSNPKPYPWASVAKWAFWLFIATVATSVLNVRSFPLIDRLVGGVLLGIAYAIVTALVVGISNTIDFAWGRGDVPFLIYLVFLIALLPTPSLADFSGPVVSVLDGDTIEVLNGHHAERIRLSGIDCPEKGQAFGKKAKQVASNLAFGKQVTVQIHGHDKYTRTLGM